MTGSLRGRDTAEQWRRRREDLRIQNHDDTGRTVGVAVWADAECRHRATYELAATQAGSALTVLPDGEYRVTATVDGDRRDGAVVRVSDRPDETLVIAIEDGDVTIATD